MLRGDNLLVIAMIIRMAAATATSASAGGSMQARTASEVVTDLSGWLANTISSSRNTVGVAGFIVAGDTIHTIAAGYATISRAYDRVAKRVTTATPVPVSGTETPFMLASTSKTVTWTALTMLLDAGAFALDGAVEATLGFPVRNPAHPGTLVTYRSLYTHTSGIKDDFQGYLYGKSCPDTMAYPKPLEDIMRSYVGVKSHWYKDVPGSKYHYSNMGTALAALLVERLSGVSFEEYTRRFIFAPLSMHRTSWVRPRNAADTYIYRVRGDRSSGTKYDTRVGGYCYPDWPSGQLYSTAGDMAVFAAAMLAGGQFRQEDGMGVSCLYSAATGKLAFTPASPKTGDGDSALGWFVGKPYYIGGAGHDGSEEGVAADLYIKLTAGVAVGWLANGELSNKEYETLTGRLMQAAEAIGAATGAPKAPAGCKAKVLPLAGTTTTAATNPISLGTSPPPCTDNASWHQGRWTKRTCIWVSKNKKRRCRLTGAKNACPITCQSC